MFRLSYNKKLLLEWALWIALALIAYNITFVFDKPLEGYRYGATGWPRFILIAIMAGATFQAVFRYFRWEGADEEDEVSTAQGASDSDWLRHVRTAAIFGVPLIYLWLLPRTGFYFTTPFFIVLYMYVLDVQGWKPYIVVPSIVFGLILLIFTRLFYVALPVGSWQPFYDINNAIIVAVRAGL